MLTQEDGMSCQRVKYLLGRCSRNIVAFTQLVSENPADKELSQHIQMPDVASYFNKQKQYTYILR